MGVLSRQSFDLGWQPDADAVMGPPTGLLRMDNCVLDARGAVTLRAGSSRINSSPFADTDVHSLYTAILNSTTYRMAGATNAVYANGASIASGLNGSGDVAFSSWLGQIVFARGTSKKKYDGTTVRNWGIAAPGAAPTLSAVAADAKTFSTCSSVEANPFVWNEDDATGAGYGAGYDGTANAALVIRPATTGRGTVTRTNQLITAASNTTPITITTAAAHGFADGQRITISGVTGNTAANGSWIITVTAANTFTLTGSVGNGAYVAGGIIGRDFTYYDSGGSGTDDDLIDFYVFATEPQYIQSLVLSFDVNDGSFTQDVYTYQWENGVAAPVALGDEAFLSGDYTTDGFTRRDVRSRREDRASLIAGLSPDKLTAGAWTHFQIPRGQLTRTAGLTAGKNWTTVNAVRVTVIGTSSGVTAAVRLDEIKILGGATRPLTGKYKGIVIGVYNSGTYQGKSAVSATSAEIELKGQALRLTLDATTVNALDSQVTELWAYVMGGALDGFYRGAVKTGGPFTGAQTIDVTSSDRDMLIANLRLERTIAAPPSTIVGIAGPHYDRLLCLTATTLYPSQSLNLDSFDSLQAITVGDSSETAYWIAKVKEEIYVGTSKDIYRLSGDWTARPDLTINVLKQGLGVSHPPTSAAFALQDDALVYQAADGWRVLGQAHALTAQDVSLLYRGQTRHGVAPVNLTSGRSRVAIANGLLTAITPEGESTTSSAVLHRYSLALQRWYRHTWATPAWRSLHREPDGTLIAGDSSGYVWTLDTGTQDNAANIPVVLWTVVDDNGSPSVLKSVSAHRIRLDTGDATATIGLHADGNGTAGATITVAASSAAPVQTNASAFTRSVTAIQQRLTGSFSTFRLYGFDVEYVDEPPKRRIWDSGPIDFGQRRTWVRELQINLAISAAVTATITCDGVVTSTHTIATQGATAQVYRVPLGRTDHGSVVQVTLTSGSDFQCYWMDVLRRVSGTPAENKPIRVAA